MFHPWPCSSPALATASAMKLNNHFIKSVMQLCNVAESSQTKQRQGLLPTITGITIQQCFQFSNITSKDVYKHNS